MPKVKRYISEQEDRLISAIRTLTKGDISSEAVDTVIEAVKAQRPLDVATYSLNGQSVEDFTLEMFGSQGENPDDEPTQAIMIDFD